jgi:hypothetical protein
MSEVTRKLEVVFDICFRSIEGFCRSGNSIAWSGACEANPAVQTNR